MKYLYAYCILALTMTGCVATSGSPGSKPSDEAPQLVKEVDRFIWDYPSRFGPVPPALQELGDSTCREIGYDRATGYHPEARDKDGTTMSGGGFFCIHDERYRDHD